MYDAKLHHFIEVVPYWCVTTSLFDLNPKIFAATGEKNYITNQLNLLRQFQVF